MWPKWNSTKEKEGELKNNKEENDRWILWTGQGGICRRLYQTGDVAIRRLKDNSSLRGKRQKKKKVIDNLTVLNKYEVFQVSCYFVPPFFVRRYWLGNLVAFVWTNLFVPIVHSAWSFFNVWFNTADRILKSNVILRSYIHVYVWV